MPEKLLNSFLLGADPELVLLDPPRLVQGNSIRVPHGRPHYGWDHNGFVVEPHPTPEFSARKLCRNLKTALDVLESDFPEYRFRAGAFYQHGNQRSVTMGGHIHLDIPRLNSAQLAAMDNLAQSLIALDILPAQECGVRIENSLYGRCGDIRSERGRVEYRTLCSWLFSRKTSMLSITGIKLCAVAPETMRKVFTSVSELSDWIELFKGKDDDVDWILEHGYFKTSMEAKPDANVKAIWKVDGELGKAILSSIPAIPAAIPNRLPRQRNPLRGLEGSALSGSILGGLNNPISINVWGDSIPSPLRNPLNNNF